jgi:CubicO group peptidase (beta-lactamase class C family)
MLDGMIAEQVSAPEQVGLSPSRLQRIDDVVQTFIDRGVIAGAVTLVARKGAIAHLSAHGQMDMASGRAMRPDTTFRLASMTKPVVSVAVLMQLEEGKLLLTEPVSRFAPEFKDLEVAVPNPAAPAWLATQLAAGDFHLVPATREITIRDLLTHTSGLGSATVGPGAAGSLAIMQEERFDKTLADVVPRMARVPLSFQPGSAWQYSPMFGFDTLGRVVEIVSGVGLDEFFRQRIFEPLGMRNTSFHVPSDKLARVATVYERGPAGLQAAKPSGVLSLSTDASSRYCSGGGGLAGTAEDYGRFAQMLANGGQLDGERLLGRKTVGLMASNHIGQLPLDSAVGDMRGYRFGLGVRVLDDPAEASTLASRGTFGWAGAFGTNSWIDPVEDMVGLLLIQRMVDPADTQLRTLWPRFQTTAYQAIDD